MRCKSNLILATVLIVLWLSGSALAFSGIGWGTEADPYIITTVQQLQEMQDDLDAYYVLGNDIDASDTVNWNLGEGFIPVGTWTGDSKDAFSGTLDGMGNSIQSLHISRIDSGYQGLFGCLWGATVQDVHLRNAEIMADFQSGTLAGKARSDSIITKCSATGTVTLKAGTADSKSGGLIGFTVVGTHVDQCSSGVNVNAGNRKQVGGLIGYHEGRTHYTLLSNSYSTGTVTGGGAKQGNLVGDADGSYVDRCYSCGNGKALIGYNWENPVITNSYWDKEKGASSSPYGGTGKTTSEMMQQATFVGWDFVDIWGIVENGTYPFLKAFEYKELVGLEIIGPNEVVENFTAGYKAVAYYDDDSSKDVTNLAGWSVEPEAIASIEAGVLTTKDVVSDQSATIMADYTEGDITVAAEKTIDIFAICPTGTALQFDGVDDYVAVNSVTSDIANKDFTLMAWINSNSTSSSSNNQVFLGFNDNLGGNRLLLGYPNPSSTLQVYDPSLTTTSWINTNIQIIDGTWHHIVYVLNAIEDSATIYVDGNKVHTYPSNTSISSNDLFSIGQEYDDGPVKSDFWNGTIDDVRIYDRSLSIEEIRASMHNRLTGDEPGLVGYWDFDEGLGQIVYDLSDHGNNGQLGSTPDADVSDPAWIESDAPIGRCTPYLIATGSVKEALKQKHASLEKLEAAIAEEWMAYKALEELLGSGDYGDLKKGDIISAKQRIHSAIQHQEQSINTIEKSINQLEDALIELGYEPESLMP